MAALPIGPAAKLARDPGMDDMAPVFPSNRHDLVGFWRRFGLAGPVYEIPGVTDARPDSDRPMRIRALATSEEVDDRLVDVLDDPRER